MVKDVRLGLASQPGPKKRGLVQTVCACTKYPPVLVKHQVFSIHVVGNRPVGDLTLTPSVLITIRVNTSTERGRKTREESGRGGGSLMAFCRHSCTCVCVLVPLISEDEISKLRLRIGGRRGRKGSDGRKGGGDGEKGSGGGDGGRLEGWILGGVSVVRCTTHTGHPVSEEEGT